MSVFGETLTLEIDLMIKSAVLRLRRTCWGLSFLPFFHLLRLELFVTHPWGTYRFPSPRLHHLTVVCPTTHRRMGVCGGKVCGIHRGRISPDCTASPGDFGGFGFAFCQGHTSVCTMERCFHVGVYPRIPRYHQDVQSTRSASLVLKILQSMSSSMTQWDFFTVS